MKTRHLSWINQYSMINRHTSARIPHSKIDVCVQYYYDHIIRISVSHGHHNHSLIIGKNIELNNNKFNDILSIIDWVYFKRCYKKHLSKRSIKKIWCKLLQKPEYELCDEEDFLNIIDDQGEGYESLGI